MSLNDDAVADLQEPPQNTPELQLVAKVDNTYDDPNEKKIGTVLEKLPKVVDSIKLLNDQSSKIVELDDVASEMGGLDAISQSDAETISAAFEGILDHVSLNEYTRTPSKTNLVFTKRYMTSHLSMVKESLKDNLRVFLEQPIHDTEDILEDLQEDYLPTISSELGRLQASAMTLRDSIKSNKDLILAAQGEFINLKTVKLQETERVVGLLTKPEWKTLACALVNFRTLWKEYSVGRALLAGVSENRPLGELFTQESKSIAANTTFNIDQFVEILTSPYLLSLLTQMQNQMADTTQRVAELKQEVLEFLDDAEKVQDFIVEHGQEIQGMVASAHQFAESVAFLTLLIPNAKVILYGFASFK